MMMLLLGSIVILLSLNQSNQRLECFLSMKVNDDIWLRDEDRWCKGKILKIDSVENVTECINLSNNEVLFLIFFLILR